MEIFLNECSFHEQYYERRELENGFRIFVGTLNVLQGISVDYTFFREPHLPHRAFRNEILAASINRVSDKSLPRLLFEVLSRITPADWRESPAQSAGDRYSCDDLNVSDSSMAESVERKLRAADLETTLINFPNSRYQSRLQLDVVKNESETYQLSCVENKDQL